MLGIIPIKTDSRPDALTTTQNAHRLNELRIKLKTMLLIEGHNVNLEKYFMKQFVILNVEHLWHKPLFYN